MISFKDGILTIGKKASDEERNRMIRFIYEICFYLGQVFYFRLSNMAMNYLGLIFLVSGAGVMIFSKLYHHRLNKSLLFVWYFIFIVFSKLSALWAYAPEISALKYIKFFSVIIITCLGMVQYVDTLEDLNRLLTVHLCISLTIMIVELIGTPTDQILGGYFGTTVSGNNSNTFGLLVMSSAVISFFKAYCKNQKAYYLLTAVFLFGSVISSSRKATSLSLLGILMVVFFSFKKKHHILHLFVAAFTVAILFWLIMTNDTLYSVVGYRFTTLFSFLNDDESVKYGSLQKREFFVYYAKTLFEDSPFLGQGFANFSELVYEKMNFIYRSYAHNNYWEILADLGVVGFVLYYWIYLYMLIKLAVSFFKKTFTEQKALAISLLIIELLLEVGVVAAWSIIEQVIVAFAFLCTMSDKFDNKKFYYSGSATRGG